MGNRTRVRLGRREDLGADCANCFGLCCVALAFARSADFPFDKPAGEPCVNLDETDACQIHSQLRDRGFKGCTVFDCFGAGQKVSRHTFAGRSWRDDPQTREAMFATFPLVRRLHELLWYLDEAIGMLAGQDPTAWADAFARVRELSDQPPEQLMAVDVDAEYDAVRPLLIHASELARQGIRPEDGPRGRARFTAGADLMGADLMGANLKEVDLTGACLRGGILIAADLTGARLRRCDVLGVDMRDTELAAADLRDAIFLTQMQVNSARGDDRTRLPDGFARPTHWRKN